jgi:hypothetical protein
MDYRKECPELTTQVISDLVGTVPVQSLTGSKRTVHVCRRATVATWLRWGERGFVRGDKNAPSPPQGNYLRQLEMVVLPTLRARKAGGLNLATGQLNTPKLAIIPAPPKDKKKAAKANTGESKLKEIPGQQEQPTVDEQPSLQPVREVPDDERGQSETRDRRERMEKRRRQRMFADYVHAMTVDEGCSLLDLLDFSSYLIEHVRERMVRERA